MKINPDSLLFIDTNILLDFYRAQRDAGLSLLKRINQHHDRIITSYQVEMEFKKNRQGVILKSLETLKPPEFTISPPAFIAEAGNVKVMKDRIQDVRKRTDRLKRRIEKALSDPQYYDPVYQVAQRLFTHSSSWILKQSTSEDEEVRKLAWQRFV